MPFTDKEGHLTKAFQKENMTLQFAKRICEQKLESWLIKSLLEKLINSVLFVSGCSPSSLIMPSLLWRHAVALMALSQHASRAELHIANIDFELN